MIRKNKKFIDPRYFMDEKMELNETGGAVGNFGGIAGGLGTIRPDDTPREDDPDSMTQRDATEFFTTLELTSKVVKILVQTIAIPDLIELMDKIPKIDTAQEEGEIP